MATPLVFFNLMWREGKWIALSYWVASLSTIIVVGVVHGVMDSPSAWIR